ncbi:MAG: zinc ABC transporter substrate-binding protein [Candidatus Bathyarchaeota archaeon]|nr:zinc ABC transporter substrate-binding protein [Candidatus Bathyarchaeota archaeon]
MCWLQPYSMNSKQKIFLTSIILIIIIAISIVTYTISTPQASTKLQVVTTFYPYTYLTQQIGGEHIEVTQLIPNNTELHGWEPSAEHIVSTEDADIIIYNGAGANKWMEDDIIPSLSTSHDRTIVVTTEGIELVTKQNGDSDPHTWLSPYMAKQEAENIYNALVTVDPEHESYYTQNWNSLKSQLEQLDSEYANGLSNKTKTEIFVSHAAFGYVASRYDFTQTGVIGISADEQPSAVTIASIVQQMEEHQTYVIYFDPVYSSEYVQTIQSEVQAQTGEDVTMLKMYLMLGPVDNLNYLEQMQANLVNLQTGLGAT